MADAVQLFGAHTWLNVGGDHFQHLGGEAACHPHGGDLFWGLFYNIHSGIEYLSAAGQGAAGQKRAL
ncbi:hypothetical protein GCM10027567_22700 [Spongiibacter taiwanensis]